MGLCQVLANPVTFIVGHKFHQQASPLRTRSNNTNLPSMTSNELLLTNYYTTSTHNLVHLPHPPGNWCTHEQDKPQECILFNACPTPQLEPVWNAMAGKVLHRHLPSIWPALNTIPIQPTVHSHRCMSSTGYGQLGDYGQPSAMIDACIRTLTTNNIHMQLDTTIRFSVSYTSRY